MMITNKYCLFGSIPFENGKWRRGGVIHFIGFVNGGGHQFDSFIF